MGNGVLLLCNTRILLCLIYLFFHEDAPNAIRLLFFGGGEEQQDLMGTSSTNYKDRAWGISGASRKK